MSTMTEILREINAVDGVAGSFVCDEHARLLARAPHHLFEDHSLETTARTVVETMLPLCTVDRTEDRATALDLLYGDGRLIVRPMDGAFLGVLAVPRLNFALLGLRAGMALKALERALVDETAVRARPATPATRIRNAVEDVLGRRAGKVTALVPEGDPTAAELRPVATELERFTRLFIGRDEAEALGARLREILRD